jgi:SAM-dependent methyltransferase
MEMIMNSCRICGTQPSGNSLLVREEMYGTGDDFEYYLCKYCGCLQIKDFPENLHRYYPNNYHNNGAKSDVRGVFKKWRRAIKKRVILTHPKFISPIIRLWLKSYSDFWIYRRIGLQLSNKVLDVGSGYGEKIKEIQSAGVKDAQGVDLFINSDVYCDNKRLVTKGTIYSINGQFDVILFHHSLEHMFDQYEVLVKARELLADFGKVLIRIPTVSSTAFLEYAEKWYQLDAPRHQFLHSHKSIKYLAEKSGFIISDIWCDSDELQFIISEQYKRNISMFADNSYVSNPKKSLFTSEQIKMWKKMSDIANRDLRGDQICVVLERKPEGEGEGF